MKELDWIHIAVSIFLIAWGMVGIYSAIKNDNKSRFFTIGGFSYLIEKFADQKSAVRFKNVFWGLLCIILGIGFLYIELTTDRQ